jgi:hypothetical protein
MGKCTARSQGMCPLIRDECRGVHQAGGAHTDQHVCDCTHGQARKHAHTHKSTHPCETRSGRRARAHVRTLM